MPQSLTEKSTSCKAIKDGKCSIIDGEQSVKAIEVLQSSGLAEDYLAKLQQWSAFIMWTKDKTLLWRILKIYNRCNHFGMFQSTWRTNVIRARHISEKLGRQVAPKEATTLGKRVKKMHVKKYLINERIWKVRTYLVPGVATLKYTI